MISRNTSNLRAATGAQNQEDMSMKKKMVLIGTDCTVKVVDNDGYNSLVAHIGGYIEAVQMDERHLAYIDEEGKLKGLPPNQIATLLWRVWHPHVEDILCGPCLIVGRVNPETGEVDGEDHDHDQVILTLTSFLLKLLASGTALPMQLQQEPPREHLPTRSHGQEVCVSCNRGIDGAEVRPAFGTLGVIFCNDCV